MQKGKCNKPYRISQTSFPQINFSIEILVTTDKTSVEMLNLKISTYIYIHKYIHKPTQICTETGSFAFLFILDIYAGEEFQLS